MTPDREAFRGRRVLVTGGLGFVGSNLSAKLIALGAKVTIVDNMMPRLGGNLFNVKDIVDRIQINFSDVRDDHSMDYLVKGQEIIFHLAGQVNHVDSIRNPIQDLDINCRGTLVLLESCRKYNREVKITTRSRSTLAGTGPAWVLATRTTPCPRPCASRKRRSLSTIAPCHELAPRPRPAVCSSARNTLPSGAPSAAAAIATVLVDPIL